MTMNEASHGSGTDRIYEVVVLVYPGLTLLDAIGPNEVLSNSPRFNVTFASKGGSSVPNDHENLRLSDLRPISDIERADILLIPGGPGDLATMDDDEILRWIIEIDKTTVYTTTVCSGSLILAKTGLLRGRKACTHWAYLSSLAELGALPIRKRFVSDGKYITAAGVSAGIDMALFLLKRATDRRHAKEIQFGIEYFPNRYDLISTYTVPRFLLEKLGQRARRIIDGNRQRIRARQGL
jgi:transcriptional regulator GlxA family with amidase domain